MRGTRRLNANEINEAIGEDRFGVYRLVDSKTGAVGYVGRSDTKPSRRLREQASKGYDSFRYRSAGSAESAYKRECRRYHYHMEHGHIENQKHPARPKGSVPYAAGSNWHPGSPVLHLRPEQGSCAGRMLQSSLAEGRLVSLFES